MKQMATKPRNKSVASGCIRKLDESTGSLSLTVSDLWRITAGAAGTTIGVTGNLFARTVGQASVLQQ